MGFSPCQNRELRGGRGGSQDLSGNKTLQVSVCHNSFQGKWEQKIKKNLFRSRWYSKEEIGKKSVWILIGKNRYLLVKFRHTWFFLIFCKTASGSQDPVSYYHLSTRILGFSSFFERGAVFLNVEMVEYFCILFVLRGSSLCFLSKKNWTFSSSAGLHFCSHCSVLWWTIVSSPDFLIEPFVRSNLESV